MSSSKTPSSSSRESFLEKKIQILDNRLTLVEKFIDLRFRQGGLENKFFYDEDEDSRNNKSRSITTSGRKPPPKKRRDSDSSPSSHSDDDEDEDPEFSPETLTGRSFRSKKLEEKVTGKSTKNQRPCPASVKRRKIEEAAKDLKTCTVRIEKSGMLETSTNNTTTTSSSGRTRRTPKRFEEENFDERKTKSRGSARKQRYGGQENDDINSVVKLERPESPAAVAIVDHYYNEGPNSPFDDGGTDGEYFTFPGAQSPPRSIVGGFGIQENSDNRMNTSNNSFACDDDRDWDGEGHDDDDDRSEDDDEIDNDDEAEKKPTAAVPRRGRKPGKSKGKSPRRGKRGPYKKRQPGEVGGRSYRHRPKVNIAELPTDAIASSDPSMKLCHLCNWHFKEEVFEAHLESHARERHLKCPECGKCYYNQFILKKHMKVHQPEKYAKKCRRCDKPFIHSDKLLAHERYCVKKALEKNEHVDPELIEDLKRRSKSDTSWIDEAIETGSKFAQLNTGEKKKCPHCNKNFKLVFYERHVQSHVRTKNWQCNSCEKAYHYKHDLIRHVATEHVSDQMCEYCQKTFTDRIEFKDHLTPCRKKYRKSSIEIKNVKSVNETADTKVEQENETVVSKENNEENIIAEGEENIEESVIGVVDEVILFDEDAMNSPQQEATLGLVGGSQ